MSRQVTVHVPERMWAAIVDFEPYPGAAGLAPTIRQRLRDAVEVRQELPAAAVFRVATLSTEEATALELWLSAVAGRADAPRYVESVLELVRAGKRLASRR